MGKWEYNDLGSLLANKQAITQLMHSPEAQALASMLTQGRDEAQLHEMAKSAVSGDTQSLKALVQNITENPEGSELLRRLSENFRSE